MVMLQRLNLFEVSFRVKWLKVVLADFDEAADNYYYLIRHSLVIKSVFHRHQ